MILRSNHIFLVIQFAVYFLPVSIAPGQSPEWDEQTSENGQVKITSRIRDIENRSGKEKMLIEYKATAIINNSLNDCIRLMKNIPKHKEFLERTDVSEVVKTISENEWLIYYYYTSPWPLPDSDCVLKMTQKDMKDMITFIGVSVPDMFELRDVRRMQTNDITYIFKELEPDVVEMTMISKFSPVISAPKWMVNTWFPEGPARVLDRFTEMAGSD